MHLLRCRSDPRWAAHAILDLRAVLRDVVALDPEAQQAILARAALTKIAAYDPPGRSIGRRPDAV